MGMIVLYEFSGCQLFHAACHVKYTLQLCNRQGALHYDVLERGCVIKSEPMQSALHGAVPWDLEQRYNTPQPPAVHFACGITREHNPE